MTGEPGRSSQGSPHDDSDRRGADGARLAAARQLHRFLATDQCDGATLVGPDCGIRVNYRVGRFVKGYLPFVRWHDAYRYLQAQAYWVLANWRLHDLTGEPAFARHAKAASRWMLDNQLADGSWPYPNREWAGRVATAEGTWASIGLLASHQRSAEEQFLVGAQRWHDYLERRIAYQRVLGGEAVNYFAGRTGSAVPNNSAFLLRFLAQLAIAAGDGSILAHAPGLVRFMAAAQTSSGELPYTVDASGPDTAHYQCVQYNAFQLIDLVEYHRTSGDDAVLAVIGRLLPFVRAGADPAGGAYYDCGLGRRRIVYHSAARAAALTAAFAVGSRLGLTPEEGEASLAAADRGLGWVLARQRADGSLPFSVCEYGVLRDRRSYPRNLAMILLHLLPAVGP